MNEKEILFELKLDPGNTQKSVDDYIRNLEILQGETKDLIAINETLKKSGENLGDQYVENSKTIEANEQKIAEQQNLKKSLISIQEAEKNSVVALTNENKLLIKERNNLNLKTEEGVKRAQEINKQLDNNNKIIKENVSGLEKQKIGIGDYKNQIQAALPGLSGFIQQTEGMTRSGLAFIATPIGATIGLLAAGVALLSSYFKSSADRGDELTKILTVGKVVFEKLIDVVEILGEVVFKTIGFLFEQFKRFIDFATPGLGLMIDAAVAAGSKIADLEDDIGDRERELMVLRAQTAKEVGELRAKAITQEGELKRKTIQEAIDLETKLAAEEVKQIDSKLKLLELEVAAYGGNLKTREGLKEEHEDKLAELESARINAEAQANQATLRFQKELEKLREEELKKIEEQNIQKEALRRQEVLKESGDIDFITKKKIDAKASEVKLTSDFNKQVGIINDTFRKQQLKFEEINAALKYKIQETALMQIANVAGKARSLFREGTVAYKAAASTEIAINTRAAAIAAYKATVGIPVIGPVLAPIQAGLAIAFGLKQLAEVNGLKFARGGQARGFTIGGRPHSLGGTKFYGEDGTRFEAEADEGLFVLKKDAHRSLIHNLSNLNTRFGGVSWNAARKVSHAAMGGEINVTPNGQGQEVIDVVQSIMNNLPPIYVAVDDIDRAKATKDLPFNLAQVL